MADRTRTAIAALVAISLVGFLLVTGSSGAAPGWTVRINAASSEDLTDSSGSVWLSDRYFAGGIPWNVGSSAPAVGGTSDDALYNKHRWGMSGYDIPVPEAATYRVELRFAEVVFADQGKRVFDINGEGALRVDDLDVAAKAGYAQAHSETFDATVTDGNLDLDFVSQVEDPMISAISVTQLGGTTTSPNSTPGKAFARRINSGAKTGYTDSTGKQWVPDTNYSGGSVFGPVGTAVSGTTDDALYQKDRWGLRSYSVKVPSAAEYDVKLHFSEVVFNQAGKRRFNVKAEGRTQLNDVDVFAEAGYAGALTKTFRVKVTDGSLTLRFSGIVEAPMISGLEVTSVGGTAAPAPPVESQTTTTTATPTTMAPTTTTTKAPTTTTTPSVTTPPQNSGTMPSLANTGPRYGLTDITPAQFFSTRTCNRQRINGDVMFDQQWMKGQTFNLTDCEVAGTMSVMMGSGAPLSVGEMAIINMSYVDVVGSLQATSASQLTADHTHINGSQISLKNYWTPFVAGPAPYTFTNSVFHQIWEAGVYHSEALHVADYGSGYRFTNVAFVIDGGDISVGGYTAAINFHATEAVFDGCWFLSDGQPATYNAAAIEGQQVVVKNTAFDDRIASVYQGVGFTDATYVNSRGYPSGSPLTLP